MIKGLLKKVTLKGVVTYLVSTAAIELLLSEKVRTGIKKGFVGCRDYLKRLASEGADAYRKGRNSVIHPQR